MKSFETSFLQMEWHWIYLGDLQEVIYKKIDAFMNNRLIFKPQHSQDFMN
jgi:hypothetical protein